MESYEVLQKAIPELQSPKVAKFLGVSANFVNRWRRQPPDDEEPNGTGQRSILDRMCELIDVIFLINPQDTGLVVQHIVSHWRRLLKTHATPMTCQIVVADTVEELLSEVTDVVSHLTREGATESTLRELVQLHARTQTAIDSVQSTLDTARENTAQ